MQIRRSNNYYFVLSTTTMTTPIQFTQLRQQKSRNYTQQQQQQQQQIKNMIVHTLNKRTNIMKSEIWHIYTIFRHVIKINDIVTHTTTTTHTHTLNLKKCKIMLTDGNNITIHDQYTIQI
jgi:hypothetical protein